MKKLVGIGLAAAISLGALSGCSLLGDKANGFVLYGSEEQVQQMNEELVVHLLEEYKDNPEQAEQLRKILNERLEYLRQQRASAKETDSSD